MFAKNNNYLLNEINFQGKDKEAKYKKNTILNKRNFN